MAYLKNRFFVYANNKEEIASLKRELEKLNEIGVLQVTGSVEIYYSAPNIGFRGILSFFLVIFTLYFTNKYISEGKTAEIIFFSVLTCLLALSLKDEIVKFFNKSILVEMNEECFTYNSERIKWGEIENGRIHCDAEYKNRSLLSFRAKGTNYDINIFELDISDWEFKYYYYTYKLRYLEKPDH